MQSFRKNFLTILGISISALAVYAAYNIYYLQKPTKRLEIIVSPPLSLVSIRPEATSDIEVMYKGEPIKSVFLLSVQIKNAGNQPIADSDYDRPLSFTLPTEYRLVDVSVIASDPGNIGMTIDKVSEQHAQVSTTLLNEDDVVVIQFVVIGGEEETLDKKLSVDGRILGVKEIEILSLSQQTAILEERLDLSSLLIKVWLAVTAVVFTALFSIAVMQRQRRR